MESISNRNMKSRIDFNYRDSQRKVARMSNKKSHSVKAERIAR